MGDNRFFGQIASCSDPIADSARAKLQQDLTCRDQFGRISLRPLADDLSFILNDNRMPLNERRQLEGEIFSNKSLPIDRLQLASDVQSETRGNVVHLNFGPHDLYGRITNPNITEISVSAPEMDPYGRPIMDRFGRPVCQEFSIACLQNPVNIVRRPIYNPGYNSNRYAGIPIGTGLVGTVINTGIRSYNQYELHKQEERQLHRLERQHQWQY